jgi:hypothetical protein
LEKGGGKFPNHHACSGCSSCIICLSDTRSHWLGAAKPVSDSLMPMNQAKASIIKIYILNASKWCIPWKSKVITQEEFDDINNTHEK